MKQKLRCAVVGVGYLGKFHAQKYAALQNAGEDVVLVAVVDTNEKAGKTIADELGCRYYNDYEDLIGKCDMVSVVVPSYMHYKVGCAFLQAGVHCLIEKPFATTLTQAEQMKQLAEDNSLMLSVGYLERFNPVFCELQKLCAAPQYIMTERLAKHTNRSMDINVILDLMIHDIDLVMQLVDSPIKSINCIGVNAVSEYTDAANAYIIFDNGAVANVSVSRISLAKSRKMRAFQSELYVSANLQDKNYTIAHKSDGGEIQQEKYDLADGDNDTLMMEINNCIDAARNGTSPLITADSAINTLKVALEVSHQLKDNFSTS